MGRAVMDPAVTLCRAMIVPEPEPFALITALIARDLITTRAVKNGSFES